MPILTPTRMPLIIIPTYIYMYTHYIYVYIYIPIYCNRLVDIKIIPKYPSNGFTLETPTVGVRDMSL